MVTRMIFDYYGVEKYCDSHIESMEYILRFNRYKLQHERQGEPTLPEHTDLSFTTIIHQNDVK
ncbi:Isopenicillin N synthase-like, partial [Parasponia andersonii]